MSYRLIYAALAALAVAIIALAVAFAPEGEPTPIPAPIEALFPAPNATVIRQTTIDVDLEIGYEANIFVDGIQLPPRELTFVDATGVYRWGPLPDSVVMTGWTPGDHTVRVDWTRTIDAPLTGTFEWTFRVQ